MPTMISPKTAALVAAMSVIATASVLGTLTPQAFAQVSITASQSNTASNTGTVSGTGNSLSQSIEQGACLIIAGADRGGTATAAQIAEGDIDCS
jgi:hypothetical protein